jgi:Uma2 family endonuclease
MATTEQITTAEQLFQAPGLGRAELVRGELIMMTPAGYEHGSIVVNITAPLATHVKQNSLGRVFSADTGFQITHDPDTVRSPDVAFVAANRVGSPLVRGFFDGAPDLAVEVLSPSDRMSEVLAKIHDWLDASCRAVWLVDPKTRTVTVYRNRSQIGLTISDQLNGDDVVPGFSLPVVEVFA